MSLYCAKCGTTHDCSVCPNCYGFGFTDTNKQAMTDELKAEREAFEGWCSTKPRMPIKKVSGKPKIYDLKKVQAAWEAWQARAKLDRTQNAGGNIEVSYGRQVCPNCDTLLPGGCGGVFKDEKECQWDGEDHD